MRWEWLIRHRIDTFDHADRLTQMAAIDAALCVYWDTSHWLHKRDEVQPGLKVVERRKV